MITLSRFYIGLMVMIFTAIGCVSVPVVEQTPQAATESLALFEGSEIVLRETVLGLGGPFVGFFKKEDAPLRLSVNQWKSGERAKINWDRTRERETEMSAQARQAYNIQFENAPIGTKIPAPPQPKFETVVDAGMLKTESLAEATGIFLPIFWEIGKEGGEGSSLLWLSQAQYDELIQTRHTQINLGLFDDSVSYAIGLTDQVKNFVEKLKGSEVAPKEKNVLEIEANVEWGTYELTVDEIRTTVQTIRAQNAFARYTILANRNNPLILELMLSPASRGSLNLFRRESIGEAFWGYEIVSVKRAGALTNEDQLPL